jgi:hypothetical protein
LRDVLTALIASIEEKKAQLDRLRPLSPDALRNLEQWFGDRTKGPFAAVRLTAYGP